MTFKTIPKLFVRVTGKVVAGHLEVWRLVQFFQKWVVVVSMWLEKRIICQIKCELVNDIYPLLWPFTNNLGIVLNVIYHGSRVLCRRRNRPIFGGKIPPEAFFFMSKNMNLYKWNHLPATNPGHNNWGNTFPYRKILPSIIKNVLVGYLYSIHTIEEVPTIFLAINVA